MRKTIIIIVLIILSFIHLMYGIKYPWMIKDTEGENYTSGIFFKTYYLKKNYQLIEYGTSLECFGKYMELKENNTLNRYIKVCK